jgi:hypothetical protein
MDEHDLTQMMHGVTNAGLPPGCYINRSGVAAKQRRQRLEQIERRISELEQKMSRIEQGN